MGKEIVELLEDQAKAFEEFRARHNAKVDYLEKAMKDMETKAGRPGAPGSGMARSSEGKKALDIFARTGDAAEFKSMSVGGSSPAGPDGGYAVPEEIAQEIVELMLPASPMRQVANVVQARSGDFKVLANTRGVGASWVAETASRTETSNPKLAEITMPFGDLYANVFATQRLLDDSFFDMAEWLIRNIAEQFAVSENTAFTSGNGTNQPKGFLAYDQAATDDGTRAFGEIQYIPTGTSGGFKTASATVSPNDDLLTMIFKMKPGLRQGATWMMNSATLATVCKWKDLEGRDIWRPAMQADQPSLLNGFPVIENEDMPSIGSGTVPIAFGNWKRAYTIADRTTTLLRDPFTNKPFIGFYSNRYCGGCLVDSEAVKVLKLSAS